MTTLTKRIKEIKRQLYENSCRDLINLIDVLPTIGGYSFQNKKRMGVTFWILHTVFLFYWYIYATAAYQINYAREFIDTINSILNMSIFFLILNGSIWTLRKRADVTKVIELIKRNDDLIIETSKFLDKKQKMLRQIQIIVIFYYIFQFINDICIYIPWRIVSLTDYTLGSCIGLEPLNKTPNREACAFILAFQELTSIVAVVSYDVSTIFLLAHTTTMYTILFEDLMSLDDIGINNTSGEVSKRLRMYIVRHALLLRTVNKLQEIYSSVIGIGFGINAMSLSLSLFIPREIMVDFHPIVYYSLCVFFLYCLQGQRLSTAAERLEMAVYCCGWEKFSCKDQKLVLFMLKQSQKPVILLAAGIIPIRIYTFAQTMQSIYKFFAIFKL